jgi:hypothetical protein
MHQGVHENGECDYIKILNYIFSLRLLSEYFMIRIMKVLLKYSSMAIKCATLLDEGIVHLVYSKYNPFVMDGVIVCNMA